MARLSYSTMSHKAPLHQRIMANLPVQASWVDEASGETISVSGLTENIGESSALVNLEMLPSVGSRVNLRLLNDDETIIEIPTEVIRVERDPSKPLAALSVVDNLKKWKQKAMTAAQEWVTRNWQLNYEEEWVN
ncbi:MAG TPA: hypothetical protein VK892_11570 [Pyrinomonadaceae bacterium]|nr:hypothetical protein [Pyrinomonadaceae bacterium]